MSTFKL